MQQKKNLKAKAVKGSLLSIIGLVVIKAEDQSIINMNGKILTILGLIDHLFLQSIIKFSLNYFECFKPRF